MVRRVTEAAGRAEVGYPCVLILIQYIYNYYEGNFYHHSFATTCVGKFVLVPGTVNYILDYINSSGVVTVKSSLLLQFDSSSTQFNSWYYDNTLKKEEELNRYSET